MEFVGTREIVAIAIACIVTGYGAGAFITGSVNQEIIDEISATLTTVDTRSIDNANRVSSLEQDLLAYQAELETCEDQITSLQSQISSLTSELDSVNSEITDLLSDIENAENLDNIALVQELEELDYRMDRSEAYRLLKKTMSKPGDYIVDSVTDVLFEELKGQYPEIALVEGKVKEIIAKAINAKTPSLVWYGRSCDQINSYSYDTQVVTYFPLELETGIPLVGEIVVARVALVVSGEVNVNQNIVVASSIEVVSIAIEE